MLAVAQASLSFSAPLPTFHAVSRTSAPLMQEKSKAIPFLKKPPALDGEAAPGHCPNQRTRLSTAHAEITGRDTSQARWPVTLASIRFRSPTLSRSSGRARCVQARRPLKAKASAAVLSLSLRCAVPRCQAELKHARVCMLAVAGWWAVDWGFTVPYAPKVLSLYAHDAAVERGPMLAMLIPIAVIEVFAGIPKCFQIMNDPDAAPGGDYKFDPLGFGGSKDLQEKELANGRLAMMAFSGIVTQATLTGGGFPYTYNGVSDLVPPLGMASMPGFGS